MTRRRVTLGTAIRAARKMKGWTLKQFAAALLEEGEDVTQAALSAYERGEYAPDVDRVRVMETVLGTELVPMLGLPADQPTLAEVTQALEENARLQREILAELKRLHGAPQAPD